MKNNFKFLSLNIMILSAFSNEAEIKINSEVHSEKPFVENEPSTILSDISSHGSTARIAQDQNKVMSETSQLGNTNTPSGSKRSNSKVFMFISAPISGIGVSYRTPFISVDTSVHLFIFSKMTTLTVSPIFSIPLEKVKGYFSVGIGIATHSFNRRGISFDIPIRTGIEGRKYFIDIGV